MEDEAEAAQYRQLMANQEEMDHYRQLQGARPLSMSPPGMLEDPFSPYYAEELALSPPGLSREEAILGLAGPAPSELDMMRSARSGPEDLTHMGFIDDMLGGFEQMPFDMGMNIIDRDFDLLPAATSVHRAWPAGSNGGLLRPASRTSSAYSSSSPWPYGYFRFRAAA
jgi:hypothetical protein